jgi:hypothetical protein
MVYNKFSSTTFFFLFSFFNGAMTNVQCTSPSHEIGNASTTSITNISNHQRHHQHQFEHHNNQNNASHNKRPKMRMTRLLAFGTGRGGHNDDSIPYDSYPYASSSSSNKKNTNKSSGYFSGGSSSSSKGSSYGSYGSYGSSSSSSSSKSKTSKSRGKNSSNSYKYQHEEPMVPLAWVILLVITCVGIGMVITANEFISNSEGNLANFCRLSVNILECVWKIIYNCYHCRLSDIPNVVWYGEDDNAEDTYTDEELENMKLRPGIERALDVEHQRSMGRLKKEFSKRKTAMGNKIARKVGVVERGPGLLALLGERNT